MTPIIVPLSKKHHKERFDCGKDLLNNYLHKQAKQDIEKKISVCFVWIEKVKDVEKVQGYFTLSNAAIPSDLIPEKYRKKFPKSYTSIPATLLGRLAIDKSKRGNGMGEFLLMDALYKSYLATKQIASFAVVVDPIDKESIAFYKRYDFILLPDSGKMFLPIKVIEHLFGPDSKK